MSTNIAEAIALWPHGAESSALATVVCDELHTEDGQVLAQRLLMAWASRYQDDIVMVRLEGETWT